MEIAKTKQTLYNCSYFSFECLWTSPDLFSKNGQLFGLSPTCHPEISGNLEIRWCPKQRWSSVRWKVGGDQGCKFAPEENGKIMKDERWVMSFYWWHKRFTSVLGSYLTKVCCFLGVFNNTKLPRHMEVNCIRIPNQFSPVQKPPCKKHARVEDGKCESVNKSKLCPKNIESLEGL